MSKGKKKKRIKRKVKRLLSKMLNTFVKDILFMLVIIIDIFLAIIVTKPFYINGSYIVIWKFCISAIPLALLLILVTYILTLLFMKWLYKNGIF